VNYLAVCDPAGPPDVREVRAGIEAVLRGDSDRYETEYPCHAPDRQQWFRLTVAPLPRGAVITHTDITRQYERLTRWMQNSPIMMVELDTTGAATYANRWWLERAGRPRTEMLGLGWLTPVVPDDRLTLEAAIDAALQTGVSGEIDVRVRRNTDEREMRLSISPQVDAYGTVRSMAVAGIDITPERELLRERAAAAERQRIRADVHDTVLQRLFAVALVLRARTNAGAHLSSEDLDYLAKSVESSMTDLRSLTADRLPPEPVPDMISAVEVVIDGAARAFGLAAEVEIDRRLAGVRSAVATELLAVLSEGVANVARHAGATACTVRITVTDVTILTIEDNGIGMPAEVNRRSGTAHIAERARRLGGTASWRPTADG